MTLIKYFKLGILSIGILLLGMGIGFLALVLVYCLPVENIEKNVKDSVTVFEVEGTYPTMFDSFMVRMHPNNMLDPRTILLNNRITARDNYTDAIMLLNASYKSTYSPIKAAMLNERWDNGNPIETLNDISNNYTSNLQVSEYSRYWHGYLIILKPLLEVMNYNQIRNFNLIIQGVLLIWLLVLINKQYGKVVFCAFLYALLFLFPFTVPFCMQYCTMAYTVLIELIILLKCKNRFLLSNRWQLFFFLIIGMITSYVDFLTYPLISWGLPILFILMGEKNNLIICQIKRVLATAFMWCMGYVGMWSGKWVLASIVLNKNLMNEAIEQVLYRASSTSDAGEINITSLKAIASNLCNYTNIFYLFLISIGCIIIFFALKKTDVKIKEVLNKKSIPYLLIAISPILWYAVFKNHSYGHGSFTCKMLTISVFAAACFFIKCIQEQLLYRKIR